MCDLVSLGLECFEGVDALMENLMESYKVMLPVLGGYITTIGRINGERLQKVPPPFLTSRHGRLSSRSCIIVRQLKRRRFDGSFM